MSQSTSLFTGICIGMGILAIAGVLLGAPAASFFILGMGVICAAVSIFSSKSREKR